MDNYVGALCRFRLIFPVGTEFAKGFAPSRKLVGAGVSKTSSAGSTPALGGTDMKECMK